MQFKLKFQQNRNLDQAGKSILSFSYDPYLINFRHSLTLLARQTNSSQRLLISKLEEILIYLFEQYPDSMAAFFTNTKNAEEFSFKKVVENNKFEQLKIEDLAFLCNMSISTFKRHFQKYYQMSPHKWMLKERMNLAVALLQKQKMPSEIYPLMGYDTYANFAKAFKQYHLVSPKRYQEMNV